MDEKDIEFPCTSCGAKITAPPDTGGKRTPCHKCGTTLEIPLAKSSGSGEVSATSASSSHSSSQRDLSMEAHIGAIGLLFRVGGILLFAAAVLMIREALTFAGMKRAGEVPKDLVRVMMTEIAVTSLLSLICFLLGRSLARFSKPARILVIVGLSIESLRSIWGLSELPPGCFMVIQVAITVLLISMIWVLCTKRAGRVCTEEYQELVERSPDEKVSVYRSPFIIPSVGLLVLYGIVLLGMLLY